MLLLPVISGWMYSSEERTRDSNSKCNGVSPSTFASVYVSAIGGEPTLIWGKMSFSIDAAFTINI